MILCNGPSLNEVSFPILEGTYTFGLNKINLLSKESGFTPSAVVCVNKHVIDQNSDFYNTADMPLFLDWYAARSRKVLPRANIIYLHAFNRGFARDCSASVNMGGTVTYVALQLAFHMGFSKVALVGADHDFAERGGPGAAVTMTGKDRNHFVDNYFADGEVWQLPNLQESEYSYGLAKRYYEAHGRRIVNCTVGGKLEVFDREELSEFLSSP